MKAEFKRKGGDKVKLVVGMTGATGGHFWGQNAGSG